MESSARESRRHGKKCLNLSVVTHRDIYQKRRETALTAIWHGLAFFEDTMSKNNHIQRYISGSSNPMKPTKYLLAAFAIMLLVVTVACTKQQTGYEYVKTVGTCSQMQVQTSTCPIDIVSCDSKSVAGLSANCPRTDGTCEHTFVQMKRLRTGELTTCRVATPK